MIIRRTEKEMKHCPRHVGGYEIELKPREILDAYILQQRKFRIMDIAENVTGRIENAGKHGYFAEDWPIRFGEHYVHLLENTLGYNDLYNDMYADMVSETVDKALKDLGYKPFTLEKE